MPGLPKNQVRRSNVEGIIRSQLAEEKGRNLRVSKSFVDAMILHVDSEIRGMTHSAVETLLSFSGKKTLKGEHLRAIVNSRRSF